jgi:hypothetical protein
MRLETNKDLQYCKGGYPEVIPKGELTEPCGFFERWLFVFRATAFFTPMRSLFKKGELIPVKMRGRMRWVSHDDVKGRVVELADRGDLKSSVRKGVRVRVSSRPPRRHDGREGC